MAGDVITHAEGNQAFGRAIQVNAPVSGGIHLSDLESSDRPCLQALFVTNPAVDKLRIESSKGPVVEEALHWVLNNDELRAWSNPSSATSLLWIHGGAGMGKTMLVCGILDELRRHDAAKGNLAFFFCERGNYKTTSAEAVLRGLLYMLATHPKRSSVIGHIRDEHNKAGPGMFEGHNGWWSLELLLDKALGEVCQEQKGGQVTYLVIDALDECEIRLDALLELIAKSSSTVTSRVKWLVTSRGTDSIRRSLRVSRAGRGRGLDLDDHAAEVSKAVEHYIHRRALWLADTQSEDDHLYQQIRAELQRRKANGIGGFLHVALVVRELRGVEPGKRLGELNRLPVDVTGLYKQAEERIRSLGEKKGLGDVCQRALSAVAVAYRPLREQELRAVAGMGTLESGQAETAIGLCDSFFVMGNGEANFIHASAREHFQQDSVLFPHGLRTEHHRLFSASLEVMGTMLRRDMDGLSHPDCPTNPQEGNQTGRNMKPTPAAAEYACDYWIEHLVAGGQHDQETQDGGALFAFLQSRFLCWLEYLARGGRMRGVLSSWAKLAGFLKGKPETSRLAGIVADAMRFITHHGQVIMEHPAQVYTSALVFAPAGSRVKEIYWKEAPQWVAISPRMEQQNWSPWLQTLDAGGSGLKLTNMTFSFDGNQLAAVLDDECTIKVWDTTTGQCLHIQTLLHANLRPVWIAFPCKSHTPIAVAMETGTRGEGHMELETIVQFWDTASDRWDTVPPLDCAAHISAAVFAPDGIWLAAADNGHIGIWDWARGDRTLRFPHRREPPHAMAYSPSSANLLASAHNAEVCLWNPESGEALQSVRSTAADLTAFSFTGGRLVVANNMSLRSWNPRTGEHLQTLQVTAHNDLFSLAALSADGSRFAAAPDGNIKIWDVATRRRLRTLGGYYGEVLSLALSPDGARLASAGEAGLKVWDSSGGATGEVEDSQASRDHGGVITAIAVAAEGTRMVSASPDAVKIWDPVDGRCIWHLTRTPVSGHGSDRDSGGGGGGGGGGDGGAQYVALSPDGSLLALMPVNGDRVQIWDLEKREHIHDIPHTAVAPPSFSPDGTRVALLAQSRGLIRVRLWRFSHGRGHAETPLKPNFDRKLVRSACVVFAPDGQKLAASVEDVIAAWNPISPGTEPLQLHVPPGRANKTADTTTSGIRSLCFSSDSEHIASSHKGGEIRIWSLQPATCLKTLQMPSGKSADLVAFRIDKAPTSAVSTISKAACFAIGKAPSTPTRPFHLLTNVGVVTGDVMDPASPSWGKQEGYGIDPDAGWITYESKRVLVLPPDHRTRCVAVVPVPAGPKLPPTVAAIVMGCRSGRVVSLCFPERTGL